ncbi:MAG: glycosyltransferase family 39 protein [Kofleriaceae bacterium]|nr:glycosyltransferase family 39 protein [Kofleriaceae bacterium]
MPTTAMAHAAPRLQRALFVLACLAAACSLAHATYAAWWSDVTWDEPTHLRWSSRLLEGQTERVSHPDFDSKTPVLVPNVVVGNALGGRLDDLHTPRTIFSFRLVSLCVLAMLYVTIYAVGRWLFGPISAAFALALAAADPNLMAHGALATVDTTFALATLLALASAIAFWRRPCLPRGILAGGALGFALITKFTAILLLPLCILVPPLVGARTRPVEDSRIRRTFPLIGGIVLGVIAAWLVIAMAYGFIGLGGPVLQHRFQTSAMRALVDLAPPVFQMFPVDFLSGIDICLTQDQSAEWNSVILMNRYPDGVWFYFPVCWVLKTPLVLLVVSIIGGFWALQRGVLRHADARVLAVALVLLAAYFCFIFRTHKGYRFVLMCLPLGYLLVAEGLRRYSPRRGAMMVAAAAFASLSMQLCYLGNPLAFTNALVWNKAQIYRYLTDSNIDWLQTRRHVERWMSEHPGAVLNPPHLVPGRNVIGVDEWTGVIGDAAHRADQYAPLIGVREPDGELFHTHLRFDVSRAEFEQLLDRQRKIVSAAPCPLAEPPTQLQSPAEILVVPRDSVICVALAEGTVAADVTLTALDDGGGSLAIPTVDAATPLRVEEVPKGHTVWHRLATTGLSLYSRGTPFAVRAEKGSVLVRVGRTHGSTSAPEASTLSCTGGVQVRSPEGDPVGLYVVGSFTGWRAWSFSALHYKVGCYTASISLPAGTHMLKIAGADWSTGQGYAIFGQAPTAPRTHRADEIMVIVVQTQVGAASNIPLEIETGGRYRFELRVDGSQAQLVATLID